uniref:Uncharacterized protein n=1 Tax=Myotis myotis TaxID=51298 RepID=A0A7J7VYZ1_MYOMY|nr:hypothetical protein mMyoMyo1_012247 [Myotis myotis]
MLIIDSHSGLFIFSVHFLRSITYIEKCTQIIWVQLDEWPLSEHPGTPTAVVTKYHKPGGLKQQKVILLVLEERSLKSGCQQDHIPRRLWGRILPGLIQLLGAPAVPWLVVASLQYLCLHLHTTFFSGSPIRSPMGLGPILIQNDLISGSLT